ncbi:MBL fold metallo-hydrolase [Maridesulfovibrio sp.]|uniref:MBL fold metallo-hydrolase n=1 Tax=Maridesulfovibrio sp. TaxID=2795000 RepID=UPI0029F51DC1|nr:MBL fold metallo-hydrolase [Maridesulfovibrio sp.]
MKFIQILMLIVCLINIPAAYAEEFIPKQTDKNGYVEPFQMFDNVFYVGDKWCSSYLVKTTEGLVLLETLECPYGRWIPANVRKLGLNPADIKYILVTHGHSDHVGNAEYIQRMYGCQVVMSKEELQLAKQQSKKSKGEGHFEAPEVNKFVGVGDELVVGDTKFTFYITPGHTNSCLSIDFMVKNSGKSYRAFMVGGHSPARKNAELAKVFIESMRRIRKLALVEPKVSVNLANHPHKNKLFENKELGKRNGAVNYFIDSKNFFDFLDMQEEIGFKKLTELRAIAIKAGSASAKSSSAD